MKKMFVLPAMLAATALSAPAHANNFLDNWYVSGSAGLNLTQDVEFTDSTPGAASTGEFGIDGGAFVGALAFGGHVNQNVRAEIELSYRTAESDSLTVDGVGTTNSVTSDLDTMAALVNAYYDFMPNEPINPYISVGVGVANHEVNNFVVNGTPVSGGDDTVFAYQIGGGASFELDEEWDLTAGYRYFATQDVELGTTELEYNAHEFTIGLRYSF